jgi:hypothetical protein
MESYLNMIVSNFMALLKNYFIYQAYFYFSIHYLTDQVFFTQYFSISAKFCYHFFCFINRF